MQKIQSIVNNAYDKIFIKNMQDLVRGIRLSENAENYISECFSEIKQEITCTCMETKCLAVAKLIYLNMIGYDVTWAAFGIIEVMSSTKYRYKRMGYLASTIVFHSNIDVLMLTTNLMRKDLNSRCDHDILLVLDALSNFVTLEIARDLYQEIVGKLSSSNELIRCRAVFALYKVYLNFPEALPESFMKLKEKLRDGSNSVQLAAVNVITELARYNPRSYIGLAPIFYEILTRTTSNWLSIKIIKFFSSVAPEQTTLANRLLDPLSNYIHTTSAISLAYECIKGILAIYPCLSVECEGGNKRSNCLEMCILKLVNLIKDNDQNLKYLGLYSMKNALIFKKSHRYINNSIFFDCLNSKDISIQSCSVDLLKATTNVSNCSEIVDKLIKNMSKSTQESYRKKVLNCIIDMCTCDNYKNFTNFEWYVTLIFSLAKMEGNTFGITLAKCLIDVTTRVDAIQLFSIKKCLEIIEQPQTLLVAFSKPRECYIFLNTIVFLACEYFEYLHDPMATLNCLLKSKNTFLPSNTQAVYLHNILKLYARVVDNFEKEKENKKDKEKENIETESEPSDITMSENFRLEISTIIIKKLEICQLTDDVELKQISSTFVRILNICIDTLPNNIGSSLLHFFEKRLDPIAPKCQKNVPMPEDLDMNKWIYAPPNIQDYKHVKSDFSPFSLVESSLFNNLTVESLQTTQILDQDNLINTNYINDSLNITKYKKKRRKKGTDVNGTGNRVCDFVVIEDECEIPKRDVIKVIPYASPIGEHVCDKGGVDSDDSIDGIHKKLSFNLGI